jgi:hypothetical protein
VFGKIYSNHLEWRGFMRTKTYLLLMLASLLITMCGTYTEGGLAKPIDGLNCRAVNVSGERGMECFYTCPEGAVGPITFQGDPSLSLSKGDFDRRYCEAAPEPTSVATETEPPASPSPSPTSSPTIAAETSATAVVPVTGGDPFLAETVSMCDLGGKMINFRIVEAAPESTAESLEVQIAEQESTCYINPTNPSLLTCSLPNDITFPAHVVVSLDGAVVNDFMYSGVGCAILTTPTPSKTRSYP